MKQKMNRDQPPRMAGKQERLKNTKERQRRRNEKKNKVLIRINDEI